jgi:hypothetical protein
MKLLTLLLLLTAVMSTAFTSTQAAPPNNDIANAQVLDPSGSFSVNGTDSGANQEAFENSANFPQFYAKNNGATVWYKFTPAVSGTFTLSVINTSDNGDTTLIAIFKGPGTPTSDSYIVSDPVSNNSFTTAVTAKQTYFILAGNSLPFVHPFSLEGNFVATVITPVVTLTVAKAEAVRSTGAAAKVLVELSSAPETSLKIAYALSGTAVNGTDYALLTESVTVPAGQKTAPIKIKPKHGAKGMRTVKLAVTAGKGYTLGSPHKGKVTIVESPGQ